MESSDLSSFMCQRCQNPFQIDPPLTSGQINEHTKAELALPDLFPNASRCQEKSPLNSSLKEAQKKELEEGSSKIVYFSNASGQPTQLSHRIGVDKELFDIVSGVSTIDHPLCKECADSLLEVMDSRLKYAEEEAQEYYAYFKKLDSERQSSGKAIKEMESEYESLLAVEESLKNELQALKQEELDGEAKMHALMEEEKALEKEESSYNRKYYGYTRKALNAEDDNRSIDCQFKYAKAQLETLKKTSVYNTTFHISRSDHFATINGFRLGRLPSVPVGWPEINAAWGQTALLLSCLSKKIGLTEFNKYQIVPYGSFSYIKVLADEKELPLYWTGRFEMHWDINFDSGMAAFLDCFSQFISEMEKLDLEFNVPYEIDKEKARIRDKRSGQFYSIKLQLNSEDFWTKALRYMLTNLKWALTFLSMKYMRPEEADSSSLPAT